MSNVIQFGTRRPAIEHPEPVRPIAERRSHGRRRVRREAVLHFNHGYCAFEASIRNQSSHGVCIDIPNTLGVPTRFDLTMSGIKVGEASVRWRSSTQLGVSLAKPLPPDLMPR